MVDVKSLLIVYFNLNSIFDRKGELL